jgi:NAD-dependent deacetylase
VVHVTLGTLERKGLLKALITQNVDLLHQKGGSRKVIEVHGSPSVHYCLDCSNVFQVEDQAALGPDVVPPEGKPDLMGFNAVAVLVKKGELPHCGRCGRVLKPAITFFGEGLPPQALLDAERASKKADLMLVLGTSLTVYPVAGMPEITLRSGGSIVIVNDMETPLDRYAEMRFYDLGEVFTQLAVILNSGE